MGLYMQAYLMEPFIHAYGTILYSHMTISIHTIISGIWVQAYIIIDDYPYKHTVIVKCEKVNRTFGPAGQKMCRSGQDLTGPKYFLF